MRGRGRNPLVFPPDDSNDSADLVFPPCFHTFYTLYLDIFHMTGMPTDLPFGFDSDAEFCAPHTHRHQLFLIIFEFCNRSCLRLGWVWSLTYLTLISFQIWTSFIFIQFRPKGSTFVSVRLLFFNSICLFLILLCLLSLFSVFRCLL